MKDSKIWDNDLRKVNMTSGKPNYDYVGMRYAIDTAIASGNDSDEEIEAIKRRYMGHPSDESDPIDTADSNDIRAPEMDQQSALSQLVEVRAPQKKQQPKRNGFPLSVFIVGLIVLLVILATLLLIQGRL